MAEFVELRQTKEYARYLELIGWQVEQAESGVYGYVRKMPGLPVSVMKVQRVNVDDLDFDWLKWVRKRYRVVVSYLELLDGGDEMHSLLKDHGYKQEKSAMLPTKTLRIATNVNQKQFRQQLSAKTRYNLGLAERKKLQVQLMSGLEMKKDDIAMNRFIAMLAKNNRRLRLLGVNRDWLAAKLEAFGKKSYVVMIWNDNKSELLSVNLFLCAQTGVYYEENGSTELGRKLMAPTLAVFCGWKEAKRRGLDFLDFDGIYDDRFPIKRWQGFSRFKLSFGGEEVVYPPAYKRWL